MGLDSEGENSNEDGEARVGGSGDSVLRAISMKDFERIGKELERRGKTDSIKSIAESEDGQRISRMIDTEAVERAARSGDAAAMKNILGQVLGTAEGKRLAESIRRMMQD